MELFSKTPNIDFLGKAKYFYALSGILMLLTVYVWFQRGIYKYGIDYVGGQEIVAAINADTNTEKLREFLDKNGFESAAVQSFESGSRQYSIRVTSHEDPMQVRNRLITLLKEAFPNQVEILKSDSVGPALGEELKRKALWALGLGLLAIVLYVAFRFEFSFAIGALVALFHDVLLATGAYLAGGYELNGAALAAALTILGYSVNDTIVIFDKVREEIHRHKDGDLAQILNDANNAMLSRTIVTSGLTWFSALALFIWGGGAIQDLSLFLVAGIVAGCYSTIFIACPIVLASERMRAKREARAKQGAKARPA